MQIKYNFQDGKWYANDIADLTGETANNFLQYGQPYSPRSEYFSHEIDMHHFSENPTVVIPQSSVMTDGYGSGVSARDFDVVERLLGKEIVDSDGSVLSDRTYSFSELEELGVVSGGDRIHRAQLYLRDVSINGHEPVSSTGTISASDGAYVHGTVAFGLASGTKFEIEGGKLVRVDAEIGAMDDNFDFESTIIPDELEGLVFFLAGPDVWIRGTTLEIQYRGSGRNDSAIASDDRCFLASTAISTPSGGPVPIETIRPGDVVQSYDRSGQLVPGTVTRTFANHVRQILDVFGLFVTPGHVVLCGDGPLEGRHVPMIDILRTDGAFVAEDGSLIRAATGCAVGSPGDRMVQAVAGVKVPGGGVRPTQTGTIRAGTLVIREDGAHVTVEEMVRALGGRIAHDGMIRRKDGKTMPFFWSFTPQLPKPEDYVLARSGTTLADIYAADEWEAVQPLIPYDGPRSEKAPINTPRALRKKAEA